MLSDIKLYYEYNGAKFLFHYGFQAVILYRLGHWAFYHQRLVNPLWYILFDFKIIPQINCRH